MKHTRWIYVTLLLFFQASGLLAYMQPLKKNGRYYYSADDTHQHLGARQAARWFGKNVLSAHRWRTAITTPFSSPSKTTRIQAILNPTQTVPQQTSIEPQITWIGHASFLIQCNGFNILTDPIFGNIKVGKFNATKRDMAPGIRLDDIPPLDAIIISHNHSDHTDIESLIALQKKYDPVLYVPEGDKTMFEELGFSQVIETTWWQHHELSKDDKTVTFTCLPAYHWSARFWPDRFSQLGYRKSLCASWMISTHNTTLYFAGDTAFGPHFKEIAQEFPSIDVALMPIGPTTANTSKIYTVSHIDAKESVDAFIDLNARCFIPMHYGTFVTGKEKLEIPIAVLHTSWEKREADLENKNLLFARCGQTYTIG